MLSCRVDDIMVGVHEIERPTEGAAVRLNDVWQSAMIDFGCFTSIILWIKFKFSRVKGCVVVGYGLTERDG